MQNDFAPVKKNTQTKRVVYAQDAPDLAVVTHEHSALGRDTVFLSHSRHSAHGLIPFVENDSHK